MVPGPCPWELAWALGQHTVPAHARRAGDQPEVVLSYYPALTPTQTAAALQAANFQLVGHDDIAHQLRVLRPKPPCPA